MRNYILVLIISSLFACNKTDSYHVPLHASSYAWLMDSSETFVYTNTAKDSLIVSSITESKGATSEVILGNLPDEATGETYSQIVKVDTLFDYTTNLLAEVLDGKRNDQVFISGLNLDLPGNAEPNYALIGDFTDTLIINGRAFVGVYSKTSTDLSTSIFVNLDQGLVGFTTENDTFNLVK